MDIATPDNPTIWQKHLKADRLMSYESIDLLYNDSSEGVFGERLAFILTCSKKSINQEADDPLGVVHKVEVSALPGCSQARVEVTHEVCPGLKAPTEIARIDDGLKAIGFDSGAVVPVYNFGPKKTFNCDVRGRLEHHTGQISALASSYTNQQLASGCTSGIITLYQTRESEITFLSKTQETRTDHITGLCYMSAQSTIPFGKIGMIPTSSLLLYSSTSGQMATVDTRCNLAESVRGELLFITEPRMSITAFAHVESRPNYLFIGGSNGEIIKCDMRQRGKSVCAQKLENDKCIGRLKAIDTQDGSYRGPCIAYTNGTNRLQVLNLDDMSVENESWICERAPEQRIRDFVQVQNRIVTCGDETSIGCWDRNLQVDLRTKPFLE